MVYSAVNYVIINIAIITEPLYCQRYSTSYRHGNARDTIILNLLRLHEIYLICDVYFSANAP